MQFFFRKIIIGGSSKKTGMDPVMVLCIAAVPFLAATHALIHVWWRVSGRSGPAPPAVDGLAALCAVLAGVWAARGCAPAPLGAAVGCGFATLACLFYSVYVALVCAGAAMRRRARPYAVSLDDPGAGDGPRPEAGAALVV